MNKESVEYKYSVFITVDVRRTDNAMLTEEENQRVQQMHSACEQAVAKIMAEMGNDKTKRLSKKTEVY